jgi:hypothetical protein
MGGLLAGLLLTSCSTSSVKESEVFQSHEITLNGCPSSAVVTLPKEFQPAPSKEIFIARTAKAWWLKPIDAYGFFLLDWTGDALVTNVYPNAQVKAWSSFAPKYQPGALGAETWRIIRNDLGGVDVSEIQLKRLGALIRQYEPGAMKDDLGLVQQYPALFFAHRTLRQGFSLR